MTKHSQWFRYATIFGAIANIVVMALPFIAMPQWYLDALGLPGGGGSVVWMRQAGLLLLFISLLYIPGGLDPARYRLNAQFAVLVRFVIGLYWLYLVYGEGRATAFLFFGLADSLYAVFNGVLLRLVLKKQGA